MVGMFLQCNMFLWEERPPNFCLDSLSLIPQACKAKSTHYKANWYILFRICPKLKSRKRNAWLAHLGFYLTKDILCLWLFAQPLGILKLLCLEIYCSSFVTCNPQVRLRKLQSENAGHLFNTYFSSHSVFCFICMHAYSLWTTVRTDLWTLKEHNVFTYFIILSHTVLIISFRIFFPLCIILLWLLYQGKYLYSSCPETWPSLEFFSQW